MTTYTARAFFTNLGIGATGLTVTVDVWSSAAVLVVNDLAATELAGGFYAYTYTGADDDYLFKFKTAGMVDQPQIACVHPDRALEGVDMWSYATRTLTQTAASIIAAISGSYITVTRGNTFSVTFTALGNISTRTKLYFSVKRSLDDLDSESIIQIEETGGLLYLNGAATTTTNGTLVVNDAVTGSVTVTVKAAATAELAITGRLHYDIKMITATAATSLCESRAMVVGDVTRAIT